MTYDCEPIFCYHGALLVWVSLHIQKYDTLSYFVYVWLVRGPFTILLCQWSVVSGLYVWIWSRKVSVEWWRCWKPKSKCSQHVCLIVPLSLANVKTIPESCWNDCLYMPRHALHFGWQRLQVLTIWHLTLTYGIITRIGWCFQRENLNIRANAKYWCFIILLETRLFHHTLWHSSCFVLTFSTGYAGGAGNYLGASLGNGGYGAGKVGLKVDKKKILYQPKLDRLRWRCVFTSPVEMSYSQVWDRVGIWELQLENWEVGTYILLLLLIIVM